MYLLNSRKQIFPASSFIIETNAKIVSDGRLLLPVFNDRESIISVQYIAENGEKRFMKGGKTRGGYCRLGELKTSGSMYIAEGFATAASTYEATGTLTIVAYNSGNLKNVSKLFQKVYPQQEQIIVADNDKNQVGQKAATLAAKASGARVIIPPDLGDANDYASAGKDLKALLKAEEINHNK